MKCVKRPYNLPEFARGKLSVGEATSVAAHLSTCDSCANESNELKALFAVLDRSIVAQPSDAYWSSFIPRLHERIGRSTASWVIPEQLRIALPASIAILLVFLVSRYDSLESSHESQQIHSIVHELAASDLLDAEQSVDIDENYEPARTTRVVEESVGADKIVLREIFEEGENIDGYSDVDQLTADNTLTDADALDIVARLEKN